MIHSDLSADAFMRRILANPLDPVPRLVFADWLEESGTSSNLAWARYLRLSDEANTLLADDPLRRKLTNEAERIGACIRAKLTYRAEKFVAYPEVMPSLLPLRCQELNLQTLVVPDEFCRQIPEAVARELTCFPLSTGKDTITVATADCHSRILIDRLQFILQRFVIPVSSPADQILAAINRNYNSVDIWTIDEYLDTAPTERIPGVERVWHLPRPDEADPVIRTVHRLLVSAIRSRVTALEFGWQTDRVQVWHHRGADRVAQNPLSLRLYLLAVHHIRVMADIALNSQVQLQTGTIHCVVDGLDYYLTVRITGSAHSPQVFISIPLTSPEPATALNPAA